MDLESLIVHADTLRGMRGAPRLRITTHDVDGQLMVAIGTSVEHERHTIAPTLYESVRKFVALMETP